MDAGIDAIGFYVPQCVLNLRDLAQARSIPYAKLAQGLGQERMAIAPLGEDIVTMGAHAAHEALEHIDRQSIDTIIVATESGVDQSKSAAIYLHRLLGIVGGIVVVILTAPKRLRAALGAQNGRRVL